jgi:type I restriction enzyme S subunit
MTTNSVFSLFDKGWEISTLGEVCLRTGGNIQTGPFGSQLHASDYVPFGIPSIMPKNIGENRILISDLSLISSDDAKRLNRYLVKKGDIVYSRRGDVERRALIRHTEEGWLCGTGCLRVRFGNDEIDPLYASYYLGHPQVREWIVRHAVGATMLNLNTSILSSLPFVNPPLPEQKAIAHILGTLDDKIELNNKMNQTLEAIAQTIFKSWFVNFDPVRAKMDGQQPVGMDAATADLFPDSFEDSELGKIPKGWEVSTINSVCDISRGASPRPIRDYIGGNIPWIKIADATASNGIFIFQTKEHIKSDGVTKSVSVHPGDLILSNSATCGLPIFVEIDGCIHDGWLLLRNFRDISKGFLYHYLRLISEMLIHIADGSVQKNLNTKLVGSQKVVIPHQEIIKYFDDANNSLINMMRSNVIQSRTLSTLRDTLLPKLMSGEIRVAEAEKQMENVL